VDKVRPSTRASYPKTSTLTLEKRTGLGVVMKDVDPIRTPTEAGIAHVPGWLGTGYTKLHAWNLTSFSKVVYVDCDCLVSDSIDELFERPGAPFLLPLPTSFHQIASMPGFLLLSLHRTSLSDMISRIAEISSYDGGDTGFLDRVLCRVVHGVCSVSPAFWLQRSTHSALDDVRAPAWILGEHKAAQSTSLQQVRPV